MRHHLGEVDSTNRWLLDAARGGARHRTVVTAAHQTAGRGRRGRTWRAPPGGSLLASVLLRRPDGVRQRQRAVMAVSVAMADALEAHGEVPIGLKWPNDLLVGARKVGGVLAEAEGTALVVGIGVNLTWPALPPDLAETATAVNLAGGRVPPAEELLDAFLDRLDTALEVLDTVLDAYRRRLVTLGRRVRVDCGAVALCGVARDVDADGRLLLVLPDGTETPVAAGDVVHLRPAP